MLRDKVLNRIENYVVANYTKLDISKFVIGDLPWNFRCHLNSVQKVKEGKATHVIACYAVNRADNLHGIHFINQLENGLYQDNTWGWTYAESDYYMIKDLTTDEQNNIWDYFGSLRKTLVRINSTWIERLVFKINGDIVI